MQVLTHLDMIPPTPASDFRALEKTDGIYLQVKFPTSVEWATIFIFPKAGTTPEPEALWDDGCAWDDNLVWDDGNTVNAAVWGDAQTWSDNLVWED